MRTRNWITLGFLIAAALYVAAEGVITTQNGHLILRPASGRVGIGVDEPKSALDVAGDISFTSSDRKGRYLLEGIRFEVPTNTISEIEVATVECDRDCTIFISVGCRTNYYSNGEAMWVGQISGYMAPKEMEYGDIKDWSERGWASFSMAYKNRNTISVKAKNTNSGGQLICHGFYVSGPHY